VQIAPKIPRSLGESRRERFELGVLFVQDTRGADDTAIVFEEGSRKVGLRIDEAADPTPSEVQTAARSTAQRLASGANRAT
jgi:hypothetical protein